MIKKLLTVAGLISGFCVFSQSFSAMYPFSGVISGTINTGPNDPTPSPTANGVVFGAFKAIGTYTAPSASDVFCFGGWDIGATNNNDVNFTGSLDTGTYYNVAITPQLSFSVTLNSITFNMARASSGPRHWAVRSNKDNYANNLSASISSNTNLSVSSGNIFFWVVDSYTIVNGTQEKGCNISLGGANFILQPAPFEFRFYAWDSETTPGTFRIDTVVFNGLATMASGLIKLTQDMNAAIRVYPNPNLDGFVYIDAGDLGYSKIDIVNTFGEIVLTKNRNKWDNEKIKLILSEFPAGIYFLRLTAETKVYTERFLISK